MRLSLSLSLILVVMACLAGSVFAGETPIESFVSVPNGSFVSVPNGSVDALDEVNEFRRRNGLPPFQRDDGLTTAAMRCAETRAKHLIFGHLKSDFAYLPAGVSADSAGCAAYPASYGWMSCCAREHYQFAGAAWAMGADGKRYMHLFVRGAAHGGAAAVNHVNSGSQSGRRVFRRR